MLFRSLREEFGVDAPGQVLLTVEAQVTGRPVMSDRGLAAVGMCCAQMLHSLGDAPVGIDHDEALVLLGVLDMVLRKLLRGRRGEESSHVAALQRIHVKVTSLGFFMGMSEALDGTGPETG